MKVGFTAGIVAGFVTAILTPIINFIFVVIGIVRPLGGREIWDPNMMLLWPFVIFGLIVIWGTVFGVIYSKAYNIIPGKNLMKGLIYGLVIFLISNIRVTSFQIAFWQAIEWLRTFNSIGFFSLIIYGLVLGYLYKPSK